MTGRPSSYSEKTAALICARLSEGIPLAVICRDGKVKDPKFPCDDTVRNWMEGNADFSKAYARARAAGFDAIALECLTIADDGTKDTKTVKRADGSETEACDSEWISRSKLRVETRLKLLAKWDPKRYGDSVQVKHADADGEKLPVSETDTAAKIAALLAAGRARAETAGESEA